jgi:diguanylate cyclase
MAAPPLATRFGPADEPGAEPPLGRHSHRSYWLVLTRAVVAGAIVHLLFGALFLVLGATPMVGVNLGSVGLYLLAWGMLRQRRNRIAVVLVWAEILLHAAVATRVLGWDSGFHYYVLVMLPMVFVSPTRHQFAKVGLGLLIGGYYLALDSLGHHHAPLASIAPGAMNLVRMFNIATTLLLLAVLANFYLRAVLRAERRLHDLATTDTLTSLANRRRGLEVAVQHLGRRRRDGAPLSFILGDVDHFKSVNDRFGHDKGDRLLTQVAQALQGAVREHDTVCRWGGEEFLIVLPGTALAPALQVAERVREAVNALVLPTDTGPMTTSITLGVSTLRDGEALEDTIARADAAMYRGKLAGRNRCTAEAPGPAVHTLRAAAVHDRAAAQG